MTVLHTFRRALRRSALLLLGGAGLVATPIIGSVTATAAPTNITSLRSQATALAAQIDTIQTKIEILAEQYDQAASRASALEQQQAGASAALGRAQQSVATDTRALHTDAVNAYVGAGAATDLSTIFSQSAANVQVQQTYIAAASGSLDSAIATLRNAENSLQQKRGALALAESHARANADSLASSKQDAESLQGQLQAKYAGVHGSLQAALAAAAAAEEAQARAAAARQAAAAEAASAAAGAPSGVINQIGTASPSTSPPTVGASGSGSSAVAAAESQIGVPYVWAGSSPGSGFDCSGLTMWAWGQAGVSLPHSAQAQYDSIEHISASQLQPGDLIFYASGGYIYHVIMYIGGGRAVQAEDTGTRIQITPVWGGAMGYGRP